MTREDIIRMAREAGLASDAWVPDSDDEPVLKELERFAQAAYAAGAAAEREACAKVCEFMRPSEREFDQRFYTACTLNANAIRARRDVVTYGEATSRGNA